MLTSFDLTIARVNEVLVNNCAIVYDSDEEFGTLLVVEC